MEVLEMSDAMIELIGESVSEAKIAQLAQKEGMITMRQDGVLKVLDGVTTIEEVLRATTETSVEPEEEKKEE